MWQHAEVSVAHHARFPFAFREISSFLLSEYDALVRTV